MVTVFCNPLTELKRQRINSPQYQMVYGNYYRWRCNISYRLPYYFAVGNPQSSSTFGHYIVAMSTSVATIYPLFTTKKFGTSGIVQQSNYAVVNSRLSALQATSTGIYYLRGS